MSDEKKRKYLMDEQRYSDAYVRCWAEGRGRNKVFVVQVWSSGKCEGEPDGDWEMPGVLGVTTCIEQAIFQTNKGQKSSTA